MTIWPGASSGSTAGTRTRSSIARCPASDSSSFAGARSHPGTTTCFCHLAMTCTESAPPHKRRPCPSTCWPTTPAACGVTPTTRKPGRPGRSGRATSTRHASTAIPSPRRDSTLSGAKRAVLQAVPAHRHVAPVPLLIARPVVVHPAALRVGAGLEPCPGAVLLGVVDDQEQTEQAIFEPVVSRRVLHGEYPVVVDGHPQTMGFRRALQRARPRSIAV